jgi:hypothetical protein
MTQLFTEYLIQQKQISKEQVVLAMIEQIRNIPSVAEIVYDNELLAKEEIYNIFSYCQKNGSEFCQTAQSLGYWSKELEERVEKEINKIRKPLADIFMQNEFITLENLTSHFVSYVEEVKNTTSLTETQADGQFDINKLNSYNDKLFDKTVPNIQNCIQLLEGLSQSKEPPSSIHEKFQDIGQEALKEFLSLNSFAEVLGAKQSHSVSEATIQLLDFCATTNMPIEINCVTDLLKSSIKIMVSIGKYMKDFKQESY